MLRKIVKLLFHLFVLLQYFWVMWCMFGIFHTLEQDYDLLCPEVQDLLNFRSLFFTSWNSVIQVSYFILAAAHDFYTITGRSKEWTEKLDSWKGYVFVTFAFPCCFFVSALFWTIYLYDRELILPAVADEYVPSWMNHAVHTNIIVFIIVEVFISNQQMPNIKHSFYSLTILEIIYTAVYYVTYFISKRWIYLFYYLLSWSERMGITVFNYVFGIILFFVGVYIEKYKHKLTKEKRCLNEANKQLVYETVKKESDNETKEQTNGLRK